MGKAIDKMSFVRTPIAISLTLILLKDNGGQQKLIHPDYFTLYNLIEGCAVYFHSTCVKQSTRLSQRNC